MMKNQMSQTGYDSATRSGVTEISGRSLCGNPLTIDPPSSAAFSGSGIVIDIVIIIISLIIIIG